MDHCYIHGILGITAIHKYTQLNFQGLEVQHFQSTYILLYSGLKNSGSDPATDIE